MSANSFLSMAEPVQCLSGTGYEPASLMFDGSNSNCDAVLSEESALPVSSSPLSKMMSADGTELRASSVSATTVEATASAGSSSSSPPPEGQLDHIGRLRRACCAVCSMILPSMKDYCLNLCWKRMCDRNAQPSPITNRKPLIARLRWSEGDLEVFKGISRPSKA